MKKLITHFFHAALTICTAIMLNGCVNGHVSYSLGDVRRCEHSQFADKTLNVQDFKDLRRQNKKSVSFYVRKHGSYGHGLTFSPTLEDYDEVFKKIDTSSAAFYCAPDSLYWVAGGPLKEMREMLAKHIDKTALFDAVTLDPAAKCDYSLRLSVRRFLCLKERRQFVDELLFFYTSAFFSSIEIATVDIDWALVDEKSGETVKSGSVKYRNTEDRNCLSAKKKPFRMNCAEAKRVAEGILESLQK